MDQPHASVPQPHAEPLPQPLPAAGEFAPGQVLTSLRTNNIYTVGSVIGQSPRSRIYACRDVWQNDLALKVIRPGQGPDRARELAQGDLANLSVLRHPNLTYLFDAFEQGGALCLVTERCFCPVSQVFTLEGFDGMTWLMPLARGLLQAVHYLHLNGAVHHAIHAGNVFAVLVKDEMPSDAKVIQFKLEHSGLAWPRTQTGAPETQPCVPPEALKPDPYGAAGHLSDLYQVALLLLQFAASKPMAFTREEILEGKPRQLAQTLPPPLDFALGKALRRHVRYRTASAMELWRDLQIGQASPAQPA